MQLFGYIPPFPDQTVRWQWMSTYCPDFLDSIIIQAMFLTSQLQKEYDGGGLGVLGFERRGSTRKLTRSPSVARRAFSMGNRNSSETGAGSSLMGASKSLDDEYVIIYIVKVYLSISVRLSVYLSICQSVCLSVCLHMAL